MKAYNHKIDFKAVFTGLFLIVTSIAKSQVLISDAIPVSEPNANALLELRSTNNKGLLMPKVALTATNAATPLAAHVTGMTVYNTQRSGTAPNDVTPGFYYNDGTKWNKISVNKPTVGDIKQSASAADHLGWYLLNGRNIATLPAAARAYAQGLGFTTVLPNAANRFLKGKQGTEVLGAAGGSESFLILQGNLPNITYSGSTNSTGAHTHTYNDRASGIGQGREINEIPVVDNGSSSTLTTSSSGVHSHTFSVVTGGSGTEVTLKAPYLVANIFVYLGN